MPDWIVKLFDSISSGKSAARALGTVLLVLFLWQPASELFNTISFPDNYKILFLTIGAFSVSYLVVRLLEICWFKISGKLADRKIKIKKQNDLAGFRNRVKKSLPHLSPPELRVLRELSDSEQRMDIRREGVSLLLKSGWISKIHQSSAAEFIFQIDPVVRTIFIDFEGARFEEMVSQTVAQLTDPQRQFLDLFWQDTIIYGTRSSQTRMPYDIYRAGLEMVTLLGLSKSECNENGHLREQFVLNDFAKSKLESEIFGVPPIRHEIELDLRYVDGSGATGGGARGGI